METTRCGNIDTGFDKGTHDDSLHMEMPAGKRMNVIARLSTDGDITAGPYRDNQIGPEKSVYNRTGRPAPTP